MRGARGVARLRWIVDRARLPAPFIVIGRVRMPPIAPVRVIEEEAERFGFAGGGEFGDQVASGGRVAAVEVRMRAAPEAETVVVARW